MEDVQKVGGFVVGEVGLSDQAKLSLQKLKLWGKVRKGELHNITREDVSDLIRILDWEGKSEVTKEDLLKLQEVPNLSVSQDSIRAIAEDADKDGDGKITVEELFKALTEGQLAYKLIRESLGRAPQEVDEHQLQLHKVIGWLRFEFETSTALWSLPQTLVMFCIFVAMMGQHIDLTTANKMQSAIANEIEGEGPPYLHNHEWAIVHDVDTLWQWMSSSFISLHFKEDLDNWPYPGRVAAYNKIVGGIQLKKTDIKEPRLCAQSSDLNIFYDSEFGGRCHRSSTPEDYESTSEIVLYHELNENISARFQNLSDKFWISQNTSSLDVNTLYYNAHLAAFTDCHLTFSFLASGVVFVKLDMETFKADPYFDWRWIIVDAVYVVILLKMLWQESGELFSASREGMEGFSRYMEFWNFVDWMTIIVGGVVVATWLQIFLQLTGEMQDIIGELPMRLLDRLVIKDRSFLTWEQINEVKSRSVIDEQVRALHLVSNAIAARHRYLRELIFVYSFVLMMKFFKAFQANPRLDIVIRTLTKATVEIVHFLLVFGVIFLCFSSAGYVLFGGRVAGFRDQTAAMFTCWTGSFDVDEMTRSSKRLTMLWVVAFQFLALMILLNMLLAIIFDNYAAAKSEKGDSSDQLTIWTQVSQACYKLQETRGHQSLYSLLLRLEDEEYPAHPALQVTKKSLRKAFPKMTKHQVEYIMRQTAKFIRDEQQDIEITLSDALQIISSFKVNLQRSADHTSKMLPLVKEVHKFSQQAIFDAIWEDPDAATAAQKPKMGTVVSSSRPMLQDTGITTVPMNSRTGTPGKRSSKADSEDTSSNRRPSSGPAAGRASHRIAAGSMAAPPIASSGEVLAQLKGMQKGFQQQQRQMVEILTARLKEHKDYCQERDAWLDQKMTEVSHHSRQALEGSQSLQAKVRGVEFSELPNLLSRLESIALRMAAHMRKWAPDIRSDEAGDQWQIDENAALAGQVAQKVEAVIARTAANQNRSNKSQAKRPERDVEDRRQRGVDNPGLLSRIQRLMPARLETGIEAADVRPDSDSDPMQVGDSASMASIQGLGQKLDKLSQQVKRILEQADETAEVCKVLSKTSGSAGTPLAVQGSHHTLVEKLDTLSEQVAQILKQAGEAAEARTMLWKLEIGGSEQQAGNRMLVQNVDMLGEQVKRILEQADEAAEARKVLWRIDNGIRHLRQSGPPPPPLPPPPLHRELDRVKAARLRPGTAPNLKLFHDQAKARHGSAPFATLPGSTGESPSCFGADGLEGQNSNSPKDQAPRESDFWLDRS